MARPILKWVGGKTQLLPEILPLLPSQIKTYYEPFFGGGAVFFALAGKFHSAVINDWNPELINLYSVACHMPETLIEALGIATAEYVMSPESTYYSWRARDVGMLTEVERAARTILLNKAGFNGLYRQNKKGLFNVPWGKRLNPTLCDADNIRAVSEAFQGVVFHTGDFAPAVTEAGPGDVVYFDPPYLPLTETANFTGYTSDGFSMKDQERLAATFRQLVGQGATCVLSNHDVPVMRDLFAGFDIHVVPARRNVSSKGTGRGPVNEVLVVGRPWTVLSPREANGPNGYPINNPDFQALADKVIEDQMDDAEQAQRFLNMLSGEA